MKSYLLLSFYIVILSFLTFGQSNSVLELENFVISSENNSSVNQLYAAYSQVSTVPNENPATEPGLPLGSWSAGVMGDVSFPFGEDFKNFAGTGFSGHFSVGYSFVNTFRVNMSVGYVKFGEKSESFEFGESTQNFSQIPILLGGEFYPDLGPDCMGLSCLSGGIFKPYLGFQVGYFIQKYTYKQTYNYFGNTESFEESENEGKFGVVPNVGGTYKVGPNINLKAGIFYNYIFHKAEDNGSNINYLSLNFGFDYGF